MTRYLLCALALLICSPSYAGDDPSLEQLLAEEVNAGVFMGNVLIANGDEVIFEASYGSANLEWGIANASDTKFQIGSLAKQINAAAIMLLKERGFLDLDDPVKAHFPKAPPHWDRITLRHLLTHTSGIVNITAHSDIDRLVRLPLSQEEQFALFIDEPLEFAPGERWQYSNSGYLVLDAVIENVSGETWEEFTTSNIFAPLGMNDTGLDDLRRILPKRASGYSLSDGLLRNAEFEEVAIRKGAGGLYSTTRDLLKWQRSLFNGKLLSAASVNEMMTPAADAIRGSSYGLGFLIQDDDDGRLIWHRGSNNGFKGWVGYDPDADITVIILTNIRDSQLLDLGPRLMQVSRARASPPN